MIDEFSEMCERIKSVAERISPGKTVINTLWDDIGRLYAEKAYPIINEVENSMRRLIAKFMLINVGMNWSKDAITPELFNKIENFEDEQIYSNDLHKLDFIHLKQVLFDKKRDINLEDLDRLLAKTKFSEEDKEKILKYIPKSNWEKYFSSLLDEKDSSIEKKWEILYKLRNKVAHNRNVKKEEFNQILGLSSDIKDIILKATTKLGEIDLNEEDRGLIIHSYPQSLAHQHYLYGEKAVIQYYLDTGYKITISQRSESYDFIALNSDGEHGVEVKVCSSRNASRALVNAARQVEHSFNKPNTELVSAHIVIAITDDFTSTEIEQLAETFNIIHSRLSGKVSILIGALDNVGADAKFTLLFSHPHRDLQSDNK
jgi:DNA-binding transcriptional MerR regulator